MKQILLFCLLSTSSFCFSQEMICASDIIEQYTVEVFEDYALFHSQDTWLSEMSLDFEEKNGKKIYSFHNNGEPFFQMGLSAHSFTLEESGNAKLEIYEDSDSSKRNIYNFLCHNI